VEEAFWKAADLTGQTLTVRKNSGENNTACLLWLRFVPMTEPEVAAYTARLADNSRRNMLAHVDMDYHAFDMAKAPHDYCKVLYALKDSDVEILSQEISNDLVDFSRPDCFMRDVDDAERHVYQKVFDEKKREIYKEQLAYAHANGMKMYAAARMGVSSFCFPYDKPYFDCDFANSHPEWRCVSRDGFTVDTLSYAYPQVQDYMVEHLAQGIRYGFDGVTLLFSRGMAGMFEQPVLERFAEKYGTDTDCRRLLLDDPRLTGIWSDIMTEFMRKLRKKLDEAAAADGRPSPGIFVTNCHAVADGLRQGVDVERWAKEGLITGVVQTNMTIWEDLSLPGILAQDGLIDLEAYTRLANSEYVIKRTHGNDPHLTQAGLPEYRRLADTYGLRLFSELQWENTVKPEDYLAAAKGIYRCGGQSIGLWDCYPPRVFVLSEWDTVRRIGNAEETLALPEDPAHWHRIHKILSYKGMDIRHASANWRG
jgi:hypothetical protein